MKEYVNGIYPRRLWICTQTELEQCKDCFILSENGEDIDLDDVIGYSAVVWNVQHCHYGYGLLVFIVNKLTPRQIAHEAAHVTLEIFKDCDCRVDYENQEPFAYLLGWAYECIEQFEKLINDNK